MQEAVKPGQGKALSINRTPKSEISQPGKIFVLNSS
jgi:hypothetical protein